MQDESTCCECTECLSEAVVHVTNVEGDDVVERHYCEVHAPDDVQRIAERELRRMHAPSVEWKSVIGQFPETLGLERTHLRAMRRGGGKRFRSNES